MENRDTYTDMVMDGENIDTRTKEMAHVAVALVNETDYYVWDHSQRLIEGFEFEQATIDAIATGHLGLFDEREWVVVEFAQ